MAGWLRSGDQQGDTRPDGAVTCTIAGGGFCDSRSITATVTDSVALECGSATSAPAIYEKTTTVTGTSY